MLYLFSEIIHLRPQNTLIFLAIILAVIFVCMLHSKESKTKLILMRVTGIMLACTPLLFADILHTELSFAGFRDGHVTEYEQLMRMPQQLLIYLSLIVGCYLVYRGIKVSHKKDLIKILLIICIYTVVTLSVNYGLRYYFLTYLQYSI